MVHAARAFSPVAVGRYALCGEIASGGMATIYAGRLLEADDPSRVFAVKRLHPHLAKSPEFVAMFLDEARVAARIRHPNVVSIIDVVSQDDELLLVMDYIEGESLSRLLGAGGEARRRIPPEIAVRIMADVLEGLHAAHEITDDAGVPLGVVHRDVSPQNVLVGRDGISHLIDFGVAKAAGRLHVTKDGAIKGKIAYMAPEQIRGTVDRRADVYAASTVLWEMLVGRRLFPGMETQVIFQVLNGQIEAAGTLVPGIPKALDAAIMKGLSKDPERRYANALQMAEVIKRAVRLASAEEVAQWIDGIAHSALVRRAEAVRQALAGELRADANVQAVSRGSSSFGSAPDWGARAPAGSGADVGVPGSAAVISSGPIRVPGPPAPAPPAPVVSPLPAPSPRPRSPWVTIATLFVAMSLLAFAIAYYLFSR